MRVIVAPDSFKGTFSAEEVAAAMAVGVRQAGADVVQVPLADGGEGTVDALVGSSVVDMRVVEATAPDGRTIEATYALDGATAYVETAAASGLHLIDPDTIDAYEATSAGTGQVLVAARDAGATQILLGVGGSGFSDGGAGALAAIDAAGGLAGVHVKVLCDVAIPYEECAEIFGPQKGADPSTAQRLTTRLQWMAGELPRDPLGEPRTGAAGGLAGALWSRWDAELVSGIDEILTRLRFADLLTDADLVITGEGRLDDQTQHGKVIDGVARWAASAGVPVHAVVGQDRSTDGARRLKLASVTEAGDETAMAEACYQILTNRTRS